MAFIASGVAIPTIPMPTSSVKWTVPLLHNPRNNLVILRWTISLAADGDYTITSVSNPSEGNLRINDINELECGTAIRPISTWTIEPRGRDAYVIGCAANALAINLPRQVRQSRPVTASSRNNRDNQRWILDPNPLSARSNSGSGPGTSAAAQNRYTTGTAGRIIVQNNLKVPVYAATSSSNRLNIADQNTIDAGGRFSWQRGMSELVHVSTATGLGSFRTYQGLVGSTVHIDHSIPDLEWNGITSVATASVRYTSGSRGRIGVLNDLDFAIYVVVLSSAPETSDQLTRRVIAAGESSSWPRNGSEVVLISMASTRGFVRAYHGRPGHTLIIESPSKRSLP
ncbi:hypothetical protein BJ138DRAFT_532170 [Hygrophoropsis aurantiaca]|uniref:Uncharacterized protein n=1 Tax=Hygrophoropsis aurantiaca TaxID=72124 RepID=A0ACB8A1H5_9AGAM|nr:hypothetical protein BJ138DRAFT_532170 [Hygrophoropsis aurantiaca]